MNKELLTEALGWIGVVCIVGAYTLSSLGFLGVTTIVYLSLNIIGAIGIAIDAYMDHNTQSVALNVVWFFIAFIGIVSHFV